MVLRLFQRKGDASAIPTLVFEEIAGCACCPHCTPGLAGAVCTCGPNCNCGTGKDCPCCIAEHDHGHDKGSHRLASPGPAPGVVVKMDKRRPKKARPTRARRPVKVVKKKMTRLEPRGRKGKIVKPLVEVKAPKPALPKAAAPEEEAPAAPAFEVKQMPKPVAAPKPARKGSKKHSTSKKSAAAPAAKPAAKKSGLRHAVGRFTAFAKRKGKPAPAPHKAAHKPRAKAKAKKRSK